MLFCYMKKERRSALRVSKKWHCHFFEVTAFPSRLKGSRAGNAEKYENLRVFIRSAVHAAGVGLKVNGCGP